MREILEGEKSYITTRGQALREKRREREQALLGTIIAKSGFNPRSATDIIIGNQNPAKVYRTAQALDINVTNKQISSRDLRISINRADQTLRIFNTGNHTHKLLQDGQSSDLRFKEDVSLSLNQPWSMRFAHTRIEIHNLPEQGRLVIGNTADSEGKALKPDASWVSVAEYEPVVKVEEPTQKSNSRFMRAMWEALSAPQS